MPHGSSWLPGTREEKLDMANIWFVVLAETHKLPDGSDETNAAAWGVPEDMVGDLGPLAGRCAVLLAKVKDPEQSTRVLRKRCKAEFALLEKAMRALHTYFYTAKFPEVELYRLGLLPHGEGGGVETEDDKQIELSLRTLVSNHEVIGDFRRLHSASRGKGKHHAAEFRLWKRALDEPGPVDAEEAGWESFVDTATPWHMAFDGTDAGMRLYIAMRWENRSVSGDKDAGKGPWSEIKSAIIP